MFGFSPPTSEHLTSKALAFERSAFEGIMAYDPPASGETYDV